MFELSVACKYLLPRRRQLSVSIISLISVLVIALVVWLIVVFFSVTNGLEKSWVQKLTALTAPVRITPTDAYTHSYYYLIDSISEGSNYSTKTIREKNESLMEDPYNPELDEEIPSYWAPPDQDQNGHLKDLVKLVYSSLNEIKGVPGLKAQDFELTATHIQLDLLHPGTRLYGNNHFRGTSVSSLSYPAYLGNFDTDNEHLGKTLLPLESKDLTNLLALAGMAPRRTADENPYEQPFDAVTLENRLRHFFKFAAIKKLKVLSGGWNIPNRLLPAQGELEICAVLKDQQVIRLIASQKAHECSVLKNQLEEQGLTIIPGKITVKDGKISFPGKFPLRPGLGLTLSEGSIFPAKLDENSIAHAKKVSDLQFEAQIPIQGITVKGKVPYRGFEIGEASTYPPTNERAPLWIYPHKGEGHLTFILPKDQEVGDGILLPKSFRDSGVMVGDRGSLSYFAPTASIVQEQQIPIYVAGFYDPGIIPIGGKFILANQEVASLIRASHNQEERSSMTNGLNVRFDQLDQAEEVKGQILKALKEKGISRYWNVETYREFEFTKEIMRELQSQKNLFMLIAVVVILVACSNIISMLIILVNDKKTEIGILRSMGASSKSIALIFGMAGAIIGMVGSVAGIAAAMLTLSHLDTLTRILSKIQGHEMFSAQLYGQTLPHELSTETLLFVLLSTSFLSLLAGIVPAVKACLLKPSHILRSGGG